MSKVIQMTPKKESPILERLRELDKKRAERILNNYKKNMRNKIQKLNHDTNN